MWTVVLLLVVLLLPHSSHHGQSYATADVSPAPFEDDLTVAPSSSVVVGIEGKGTFHVHAVGLTGNWHRYCMMELGYKADFLAGRAVPCLEDREMAGRSGLVMDYALPNVSGGYAAGIKCLDGSDACHTHVSLWFDSA